MAAAKTKKQTVLVTGASGFIARHCIIRLLNEGYQVRGSLRTMGRQQEVRDALAPHADISALDFCELDLGKDDGWEQAATDCSYVQHIASPFPAAAPEHEDDLIIPAREGALRALRASASAGVKRVVLTSSMAAIAYGNPDREPGPYTEKDWTDPDANIGAYVKSKTLAELAAWDFIKSSQAGKMELSVINPGAVLGPVLDKDYSTSGELVRKLLRREMPACPRISFAMIDVRDVADAHFEAMVRKEAAGERFMLIDRSAWMVEISRALHANGFNTPTGILPDFMVRIVALFDKTIRMAASDLGRKSEYSNTKLQKVLGIKPRDLEEMSVSMAKTMVEHKIV